MYKATYGRTVIFVRRATVGDDLRGQRIAKRLTGQAEDNAWGFWPLFADLNSHVVKSKGLPFDPLTLDSVTDERLQAAYDAFLTLDKGLKDQWQQAVTLADKPADGDMSIEALPDDADPNL